MSSVAKGPPLDTAAIFSTTIEGILYGVSLLMFGLTVWVLVRNKRFSQVNYKMLVASLLLFIFSTIHIAVDINRIYIGFIKNTDHVKYFEDVSQETFVFKNAIYSFQTAVGDGVVLFRAYTVWKSVWIIILPLIVYCGVIAASIGSVYTVSLTTPNSSNIFFQTTGRWITSFYASTFACNLLATALLAFRLWWIERKVTHFKQNGRGTLRPILMIVIDSGLLYSISLFSALMCFVTKNNAQFIVLDFITPIISISFYGVILRVALVQAERERSNLPSRIVSTPSGSGRNNAARAGMSKGHGGNHHIGLGSETRSGLLGSRSQHSRSLTSGDVEGYAMRPLKVNIIQEVHQESDVKPWEAA